jgi:hypothetical protein
MTCQAAIFCEGSDTCLGIMSIGPIKPLDKPEAEAAAEPRRDTLRGWYEDDTDADLRRGDDSRATAGW